MVYGFAAPFAATLLERFSMRAVAAIALTLVSAGAGLAVFITHFGPVRATVVFGWVFAFHMVGAGALTTGIGRNISGSYLIAWTTAAVLCFLAAGGLFFLPGSMQPNWKKLTPTNRYQKRSNARRGHREALGSNPSRRA